MTHLTSWTMGLSINSVTQNPDLNTENGMYTAIVWIGKYGSSSTGGFDTARNAFTHARTQIANGVFGDRDDLWIEVKRPDGSTACVGH